VTPAPTPDDLACDLAADLALCEAAPSGPWEWKQVYEISARGRPGFAVHWAIESPESAARDSVACSHTVLFADYPRDVDGRPLSEVPSLKLMAAARAGWPAALRRALAAEAEREAAWRECATLRHDLTEVCREAAAAVARRDQLQAFKDWVHAYLDARGVPADPDPDGTRQHGCRIGGRMRWVFDRIAELDRLNAALGERVTAQAEALARRAEGPAWHDAPPAPGIYVTREADRDGYPCGNGYCIVTDPADAAAGWPHYRWFGPIPADPDRGVSQPRPEGQR
jgi:hypothetical protein